MKNIYEVRFTEHKKRLVSAQSAMDAVIDIAQHHRPVDTFEVECIEAEPERMVEVGLVEEFDLTPGGTLRRIPKPQPPASFIDRRASELFPALFPARR